MSKFHFVAILLCVLTASVAAVQSDDVYLAVRQRCDQPDPQPIQGKPGKKGPVGEQGTKGDKGSRGFKGETGVCNASDVMKLTEQVQNLTEQLVNSKQQIQRLQTFFERLSAQNEAISQRIAILPSAGWFTPWNGYEYKLTTTKRNWQDSRSDCQSMGGDLAVHGMQDYTTLKTIGEALINDTRTWIGLNDIAREGSFVWADGTASTSANTPWRTNQPDNAANNEDCGELTKPYKFRVNDIPCHFLFYGLCEKRIT